MAAHVPMIVEIIADKRVISIVVAKAFIILSFWKQFLYQSKVNPPHVTLDFELLKDKTIKINIGR